MPVPTFEAFQQAADAFADLVDEIGDDDWDGPGLGDWDLRALVGHTSRSLITVRTYLARPAQVEQLTGAAEYYAKIRASSSGGDAAAVTQRGRDAGTALGAEPAPAIRALVLDVITATYAVPGDPIIETIAGSIRLSSYLPTRTFELAVHCLDIAAAIDVAITLPAVVMAAALELAGQVAQLGGEGQHVLLALTGRRPLDAGFSIV